MCGLVGIMSSNLQAKHKAAMADLLFLDTFRGKDSTGIACVRFDRSTVIAKQAVPAYEFLENPRNLDTMKLTDWVWIGHNRYGTVGAKNKLNAHPFEVCNDDGEVLLVGAHNGTLKNKYKLPNHTNFGTDSEALFNAISDTGVEIVIPEVEGAWALTWFDHTADELRVLRNDERPLFYAYEQGRKSIIWASEMWMIRVVCSRHDIKIDEDKVFSFAVDTLYRFPRPQKMNDVIFSERKGGLVSKKTETFFQDYWSGHPYQRIQREQEAQQKTTSSTCQTPEKDKKETLSLPAPSGTKDSKSGDLPPKKSGKGSATTTKNNVLEFKQWKGFKGEQLGFKELQDKLSAGCIWCNDPVDHNKKFAWLGDEEPVCSACLEGVHISSDNPIVLQLTRSMIN